MRIDIWLYASVGLANASALIPRDVQDSAVQQDSAVKMDSAAKQDSATNMDSAAKQDSAVKQDDPPEWEKDPKYWKPKSGKPQFFSLKVDDQCRAGETDDECPFDGFAIRLEDGILVATPYNKWWDPKLPVLYVDSDTKAYTVSKKPLQIYINTITGAVKYAPLGWLPPNSLSATFYKIGNNPLGKLDPSPAYFSATSFASPWWLCPLDETGQFQLYASGYTRDVENCTLKRVAAINANPWGP